jgi:excisionase family DNA binding protein
VTGSTAGRRYATLKVAEEFSGVSQRTLRRLIARQRLTSYRPVRGRVLVDLRELDALIRSTAGAAGTRGAHLTGARGEDSDLPRDEP